MAPEAIQANILRQLRLRREATVCAPVLHQCVRAAKNQELCHGLSTRFGFNRKKEVNLGAMITDQESARFLISQLPFIRTGPHEVVNDTV